MRDRNPERLTSIVVEALGRTGQRGILLSGWGGLMNSHLPDTIFPIESVPHDGFIRVWPPWFITAERALSGRFFARGVPSVAVPWRRDHPFFAACAYRLGSSARPIPKKQLSAARLAAAIEVAVHDPQIRARASAIASQVVNENGVGRAVKIIEETVRSRLCHR
jgi:sterol 3beta-glucosyltransferase